MLAGGRSLGTPFTKHNCMPIGAHCIAAQTNAVRSVPHRITFHPRVPCTSLAQNKKNCRYGIIMPINNEPRNIRLKAHTVALNQGNGIPLPESQPMNTTTQKCTSRDFKLMLYSCLLCQPSLHEQMAHKASSAAPALAPVPATTSSAVNPKCQEHHACRDSNNNIYSSQKWYVTHLPTSGPCNTSRTFLLCN